MATIRIILGIICLTAVSGHSLFGSHSVNNNYRLHIGISKPFKTDERTVRLLQMAENELGIREKSGQNDGLRVETYLQYVGLKKGSPWCAAFVSWVYGQAGFAQPRTGWSPALFPVAKRSKQVDQAQVFGIYFPELKRIAHCGLVERVEGNWIITIEGNTTLAGIREGDGVYRKRRAIKAIRYFANWIPGKGAQNGR